MTYDATGATPSVLAETLSADGRAAAEIATAAGQLLLDLRRGLDAPDSDPAAIRDAGDRRSHVFIVDALAHRSRTVARARRR